MTNVTENDIPWPNTAYAWWVAVVLILCFTAAYIDRQIISLLVVPIQRDLNISDTQFSLLQGMAFALFYTLMGIPLGRLADTYNRRNIIAVCLIMWSIMTAACGLAFSFLYLFLARVGVGIGEGGYPPSAVSMLSDYFPPERLTLPIGLVVAGTYFGGAIAFIGGGALLESLTAIGTIDLPLLGQIRPWQLTFFVVSIPGILLFPLLATVREPARRGLLDTYDNNNKIKRSIPISEVTEYIWQRRSTYLTLIIGVSLFGIYGVGATVWAPAYFIRVHGWTEAEVGLRFGTVFFVCGIAGTFAARFVERLFEKRGYVDAKIRTILLATLLTLPVGTLATLMANAESALFLYGGSIFLFSMVPAIVPSALQVITPNQIRGQVIAAYLFVLSILAIGLGPTVVALITDYVFGDQADVGLSLASVAIVMCLASAKLVSTGLGQYKEQLEEANGWKSIVSDY